jgi:hypothetical protein
LGSIGLLLEEMNRLRIRTKVQVLSNGQHRGGGPYPQRLRPAASHRPLLCRPLP